MNKKQETAIGIAVAAILVGYFVYQVAYGTNEESYMYGYKAALFASHCLVVSARTNNGDDCERAYISPQWGCGEETLMTQGYKQTNVTACNDGFINGFVHWCNTNAKDCEYLIKTNQTQIATIHSQTGNP